MSSIVVDPDTSLAMIVPAAGHELSVAELNAVLDASPYRVTALQIKR